MTYPPQQPGQFGPQPGPHGAPPGYQGPPTGGQYYGRSPAAEPYGGQNGYGYGGGQGATQQFPRVDGFGAPQDPHGRPQNDYPPQMPPTGGEPPRKKSQTGLVVAVVVAGLLVIGGVVALVVMNSGGKTEQAQPLAPINSAPGAPGAPAPSSSAPKSAPSSSSKATSPSKTPSTPPSTAAGPAPDGKADPQELATFVISAYNSADTKTVLDTTCRSRTPSADFKVPPGFQMQSTGAVTTTGDTGKMPVKASYNGQTQDGVLSVRKESGLWCLSGLGAG
jgi:hypothetical protein